MWRAVVSQPMNRRSNLKARGPLDEEHGEFWVSNPFQMPGQKQNLSAYERNCLFLSQEGKRFVDVSFASNADIDSDSRSVIVADFNRDGAQDLLVASAGGGALRLFRNECPKSGNRIRLTLVGEESNRSAIGARVTAHIGSRTIVRDLFPANGFFGQSPAEVIIGTADADEIQKLSIRWPTGRTTEHSNLQTNRQFTCDESGVLTPQPGPIRQRQPRDP